MTTTSTRPQRIQRIQQVGESMIAVLDAVHELRNKLEACPDLLHGANLVTVIAPLEDGLDATWARIG